MASVKIMAPREKHTSRKKKVVVTGFTAFLLLVLLFVIFLSQNFKTVEVKGPSMEPTFVEKDHVLTSKAYWLVGDLKRGDIVVVRARDKAGDYYIKRINRIGGESVDFMNLPENYSITNGEFVIPEGEYYLLGDNRPVSEDSRVWGPVERNEIIGKVVIIKFGFPSNQTVKAKD
ncbi:MAG: signal peptidase I [Fimbriimonadaceae bacterium]